MKTSKLIAGGLVAIFSSLSIAGDYRKPVNCPDGTTTVESAESYVSFYYDHLRTGMNREQLGGYWGEELELMMDKTVAQLAEDLRHTIENESQRYIDTLMNNARCENMSLASSQIKGLYHKWATLEYSVTPSCTDWTNINKRTVKLTFSSTTCGWSITDIKDEVKYK